MASNTDPGGYATGFYFSVSFKGQDAAFQEISGIQKEINTEEVAGGGENRFKYRLPGTVTHQNLVLKRAMVKTNSPLVSWCASVLDNGLSQPIAVHDVSVSLLDEKGIVYMMWTFFNAYPVKYAVSELKAQESVLVIESIELAYNYFQVASDKDVSSFSISKLFN